MSPDGLRRAVSLREICQHLQRIHSLGSHHFTCGPYFTAFGPFDLAGGERTQ